jgi:cyanophycinase
MSSNHQRPLRDARHPARDESGASDESPSRGYLIPIGGAEEKIRDRAILRRFAEVCGGRSARIAIIPTASLLRETGRKYERIFRDLGVRWAAVLPFERREDCHRADWLAALGEASGIVLTGGNQLKLSTTIGGTPVADLIRARSKAGAHVAGTSAGAAILSEHMIAFGDEGPTPRASIVALAPGLGLTQRVIIDQHFRQRDRLGRLLAALAYYPEPVGIGLDEDTAAFIAPDDTLEVVGSGAITVVDPSDVLFSSMDSAKRQDPVCILNIRLHVLVDGAGYDLRTRQAREPGGVVMVG